jgi:hypothetical protein
MQDMKNYNRNCIERVTAHRSVRRDTDQVVAAPETPQP